MLRPGGRVVISDLLPHKADWLREAMGDLRLGLDPEQVLGALARAGFTELHTERAADRYRLATPAGEIADCPVPGARAEARRAGPESLRKKP